MAKKTKRVHRKLTPGQQDAYRKEVAAVEADKKDILAKGRTVFAAHQAACKAIKQLKKARLRQGLSLADIRQRTGIGREAISKLENDPTPNPTIRTLIRYAKAVGVKLELKVG